MELKTNNYFRPNYILILLSLLLVSACDIEENATPEPQLEINTETISLIPKTLAIIKLPNDVHLTFKSEEDGVIFEALGNINDISGIGKLKNMTILERFLALTDINTPVPLDLIRTEEDINLKKIASKRGVIERHSSKIHSDQSLLTNIPTKQSRTSVRCVGTAKYYDEHGYGAFSRKFTNNLAGSAKARAYSSWKIGKNVCKVVRINLTNCSTDKKLVAKTYYRNVFKKYIRRNTINIPPSYFKFWEKKYLFKKHRYTKVISSENGQRFGGYLTFDWYRL